MKNIYKILFLLIAFVFAQETFAQKTLKMQVTNINTNKSTDCDGALNNSDFEWRWFNGGSDRGCAYYGGNNGAIGDNTIRNLYEGYYFSANCWANGIGTPGAAMTITMRGAENDETFGSCNSGSYCSRNDATTIPLATAPTGNTVFANNTGVTCNGTAGCDACYGSCTNLIYNHTVRWEVAGSYGSTNLDGSNNITNFNCANAIDIDGGTEATGTRVTTHANQCQDVWYIYDVTTTNLTNLSFTGANSTVTVFYDPNNGCSTSCQVASGNPSVSMAGPISTGRYYIRVSATGDYSSTATRLSLSVSKSTGTNSNDYIANATNMGTITVGGSLNFGSENNFGSTQESGEPNVNTADSDNETDWYYFTTGVTVPSQVRVFIEENGDNIDADYHLYKWNDQTYTFPRSCVNWSKLSSLGDGDGGDNIACVGSYNSDNWWCLDPSSRYYIQVRGYENGGLCSGEDQGNFRVYVEGHSRPKGADNICDATTLGNITFNSASLSLNTSNFCATQQAGELNVNTADSDNETIWYKFTTGGTVSAGNRIFVEENGDNIDADYHLYKLNDLTHTFSCASPNWAKLSSLGDGDGGDNIACIGSYNSDGTWCLEANSTYYIQVRGYVNGGLCADEDKGEFNILVDPNATIAGPDKICNATALGNITTNSATLSLNSNNFCSGSEPSEPNINTADNDNKTTWYTFTTGLTVPAQTRVFVEENGDNIDADYHLYKLPVAHSFSCTTPDWTKLSSIGGGDGGDNIACVGSYNSDGNWCLEPSSTYYIQVRGYQNGGLCADEDIGDFNVSVNPDLYNSGPDNVCNATSMGTLNGLTGTLSLNDQSNDCASTQGGEPSGGQKTVWYTFTTGATVGKDFNINMDAETNGLNSDIYIYEICNTVCTAGVPNWGNITEIDNFYDITPGFGEYDAGGTISGIIKPSTTYLIRADGTNLVGENGGFDIDMSFSGGAFNGNDEFCNAWLVGSLPASGTSESITNNDILDLGETITVGTFNNKSASTQEDCELDEWNNDEDDETVWFKFVTASNPGTEIEVDVNAINDGVGGLDCIGGLSYAWTKAYVTNGSPVITCPTFTNSTNWFNGIEEAGRDDLVDASKYYIDCPSPSTTYYIQVENQGIGCDQSSFTMTVKDNGIARALNDRICNATVLSTPGYTPPVSLIGTYKSIIYKIRIISVQVLVEDPAACWSNNENDKTVWYKLPAAAAPGASDISNPGRKVAIINAYSEHAAGDEDEINLQLALYSVASLSCPASTATYTLSTDLQGNNCAYVGPASLDLDQLFQYSEYLTAACLTPATDYYLQVDGNDLDLVLDEVLREGWFELEAYYPREIGDLPCSAVPFKTWGIAGTPAANTQDNLYNNSNLCTSYTPGVGANQEPPTTFTTGDGNDNPGWVYFYAPASGSVKITATADPNDIMKDGVFDNIDLQLAIFQETVIGNCDIVQPPQSPVSSIVSYNVLDGYGEEMYVNCLTPGRKYYIEIDGSASPLTQTRGIFDLKIEDFAANSYAPNDEMQDAIAFTNTYTATSTWNRINNKVTESILDSKNWCADNLNEPGRPVLGGYNETGVWYKFIAPPSGMVHFLAENTTYASLSKPSGDPNHLDLSLAVYQLNAGFSLLLIIQILLLLH
jgi:hypothetical protein